MLSDAVSLRFGLEYAMQAYYVRGRTAGITTYEWAPAGSAANPWFMQLGYSAGIGFRSRSNEFNIAVEIAPQWNNILPAGVSGNSIYKFKLDADLKFYFDAVQSVKSRIVM
jgi:hypothetical protein